MADICKNFTTGRLTAEPIVRGSCVFFTVASNRMTKGEQKATFIKCGASGKFSEWIQKSDQYRKGRRVAVTGNFVQSDWKDDKGQKRVDYTCWLDSMPEFMDIGARTPDQDKEEAGFGDVDMSGSVDSDVPF